MAGRKSLFEPVAEKLIAQIREGRIAPGEKMPSEYELCTHYALSRSSIRKALDCLEQKGLIRRQPGIGTFVCGNEPVMKKPSEGFQKNVFRNLHDADFHASQSTGSGKRCPVSPLIFTRTPDARSAFSANSE